MNNKTMSHYASSADYHKDRYRDLRIELDKRQGQIEQLQSQLAVQKKNARI